VIVHESLSFPDLGYGIRLGWSDFEPEFLNCDESDLWNYIKITDLSPLENLINLERLETVRLPIRSIESLRNTGKLKSLSI
jgi:hypothetical protein